MVHTRRSATWWVVLAVALVPGCARGYCSFPICKAFGPSPENAAPHASLPAPDTQAQGPQTSTAPAASATPPSSLRAFATPVVVLDVVLLPLTAPVDLGLWIARRDEIAAASRLDRSRELNLAGFPLLAFGEVLDAAMLDPRHPATISLVDAHVRREITVGTPTTRQAMVALAFRCYDALVADTDADDRHDPEFRERVAVIHGVVRDLAPDHPRLAELAGGGG